MEDNIIVAMDGMNVSETIKMAERLKGLGVIFKVNDQLDDDLGLGIIDELKKYGQVMDDPKQHDIPKTVARRTAKHAKHEPKFITVHASGGIPMISAAVENCSDSKILAVTVLTSLNDDQSKQIDGSCGKEKVLYLVKVAWSGGAHGIVCSGEELRFLKDNLPDLINRLIIVVPGIRPIWSLVPNDDQSRIVTPEEAIANGADYIVIGRPIILADDPVEAYLKTRAEVEAAKNKK